MTQDLQRQVRATQLAEIDQLLKAFLSIIGELGLREAEEDKA